MLTSARLQTDAFSTVVKVEGKGGGQFWESAATRPPVARVSPQAQAALRERYADGFTQCLLHPFLPLGEIRQHQLERVRHLVAMAYDEIPVYREKYRAAGITPQDIRTWEDFERLPLITKDELIAAFPDRCVNRRWRGDELFSTRSFGSSGKTLLIRVNLDAIVTDTLQGARQFWLQSGVQYGRDHLVTHIYTVPWWFETIGDDFPTAFISSLISADRVYRILDELKPHVISCYPSNLKALLPYWREFDRRHLCLVVTHSEGSTPSERRRWSRETGVAVCDEYSSEEATRIALELPCGHYHVCEDAVHLESLHPETHRRQAPGAPGLAVVTNLLNEAMPFIRYVQGDYVTQPDTPGRCLLGWSQLAGLDGRVNDSFLTRHGKEIPAGTILDVTYRWMYDIGVHIKEFELVQQAADTLRATFVPGDHVAESAVHRSLRHLEDLLQVCMEHRVKVKAQTTAHLPKRPGKARPIRRDFASEHPVVRPVPNRGTT